MLSIWFQEAVRKMTLQEIVKQESDLKCYVDILAFFSAFCYVIAM